MAHDGSNDRTGATGAGTGFFYDPDPDNPGWMIWGPHTNDRFNSLYGAVRVRPEGAGRARVKATAQGVLASANDRLHGGAMAGFIDIALFAGGAGCGLDDTGGAVTVDLSIQYLAPAGMEHDLETVVELVRETGRMAFLRGVVQQQGQSLASFMATIRKSNRVK